MDNEALENYQLDENAKQIQRENLAGLLMEEGVAESEEEARQIIAEEEKARANQDFTPSEYELYMKQGYSRSMYELDPIKLYEHFRDKAVRANNRALKNVQERNPGLNSAELTEEAEAEARKLRYFPVMFVSAPHIEGRVSGTFPGLPTPLLQATSVIDRYLRTGTFPAEKTPEIVRVFNPSIYTPEFEQEFTDALIKTKPRVVGISNTSEGHAIALQMADIVKEIADREGFETIVILGGSHEDGSNPEPYFRNSEDGQLTGRYELKPEHKPVLEQGFTAYDEKARKQVDLVVAGDGQYALMKLMQMIADNTDLSNDQILKLIAESGDVFKGVEGAGNIFVNQPGLDTPDVLALSGSKVNYDALPYMFHGRLQGENFFSVFPKEYNQFGEPISLKKTAQVMTALGCPHACEFCQESLQNLYNLSNPRSVENVANEIRVLKDYGYEALFFDDSTFTRKYGDDHRAELKGEPARVEKILDALISLKNEGVSYEWGCQTTFVDVTGIEQLRKMKEAGCSYIYFGFEELEVMDPTKKTRGYDKDQWKARVEEVLGWCQETDIRAGVSIQVGLSGDANYSETIGYVANLYHEGLISKNCVGLNINVTFPGTKQFVELIRDGQIPPDFNQKLKRHPDFETAHQLASLSLKQADDIYAEAHRQIGDGLIGVTLNPEIMQLLKDDQEAVSRDRYFPEGVNDWKYPAYLAGKIKALHLNHASLSDESPSVHEAAKRVFGEHLSPERKAEIISEARKKAAELINLSDPRGVAFGRNTTEAMSYLFWLAGLKEGDGVVLTDAENRSITRVFQIHLDHGNPEGNDRWSTYPTWYERRSQLPDPEQPERPLGKSKRYGETIEQSSGVHVSAFDVLNSTDEEIKEHLADSITADTKVLVMSQVIRDNGRELPIKDLIEKAREIKRSQNPDDSNLFVIIDGAQSLGNLKKVDFGDLGCDAYVATPHKTMHSTPLGLLYFNPDNPTIKHNLPRLNQLYYQDEQIILEGAFDESLGVKPNVEDELEIADISGFLRATQDLDESGYKPGDFSEIAEKRSELKSVFKEELYQLVEKYGLEIREAKEGSSLIYSFNIAGIDNCRFVDLLHANDIFVSYIDRARIGDDGTIRVSFGMGNSEKQIREYSGRMARAIETALSESQEAVSGVLTGEFVHNHEPINRGFMAWLREQAHSPVGKVAAIAASFAAALSLTYKLYNGEPGGTPLPPTLIVRSQTEFDKLGNQIAELNQGLSRQFSPGVDSHVSNLQADRAKYQIMIDSTNPQRLRRTLDDQSVVGLARTANFTNSDLAAFRSIYEQTHDQRIRNIMERAQKT